MTTLYRMKVLWTGLAGTPGTTTLYSTDIPPVSGVAAFFNSLKPNHPTGLSWTVPADGDTIESTTGQLIGTWSSGSSSSVAATGTGSWVAPSGYMLRLNTTTVVDGHRLRGRIFMVPALTGIFDSNGTLTSTCVSGAETALTALVTAYATKLVVWHRPIIAAGGAVTRAGSHGIVTGGICPDVPVVLRSRRD